MFHEYFTHWYVCLFLVNLDLVLLTQLLIIFTVLL